MSFEYNQLWCKYRLLRSAILIKPNILHLGPDKPTTVICNHIDPTFAAWKALLFY